MMIPVVVAGRVYPTYIINGVQRFQKNEHHHILAKYMLDRREADMFAVNDDHLVDSNAMALDYSHKKISFRDYAEAKMAQGYSVCGFCDIMGNTKVDNPLWAPYALQLFFESKDDA